MILGVNGRFHGARVTGVQRFAAEIVRRLWPRVEEGVLLLPRGVAPPADHPRAVPAVGGRLGGHAWERLELPGAARGAGCDVVLHPANTLPAAGGPHVVVVHDVEPMVRPEAFSPAFAAWYRWGVAPAVRRAARVVTVSRASAAAIAEVLGIEPALIRVADQGAGPIDAPADPASVARTMSRHGIAGPYLLAVGGLDPRKNIAFLREVLARWRARAGVPGTPTEPVLVVVSGGEGRVFAGGAGDSTPSAREVGLGRVDDETLRALYTGSAAFVFPSLSEGFGRPPLEALACGVPVLTSPYPAAAEVLGDAAEQVPLDADEWVARLIAVFRATPADAAARRERGRVRAAAHSWDAGAEVVLATCREAAAERGGRRAAARPRSPSLAPDPAVPRVAIVHDWLMSMRGGERVVEALLGLFPQAELFTLVHRPGSVSPLIERRPIHTSFVQGLPAAARHYRWYLPLFPSAVERFDFRGFDLVLSSSHCVAKGAITRGVPHLCYCHTPMRYAWDQFGAYFGPGRSGLPLRVVAGAATRALRAWDRDTAGRVDRFVANSEFVRGRIRAAYGRDARVVHPPVDLDRFAPAAAREEFYLIVSALVPYKRVDLAIRALARLRRSLVVVGSGPELPRLRALAGPEVTFTGWLHDEQVAELMGRCCAVLMPGVEDFGLVPVEAQAAGAPVIALGVGGVRETVIDVEEGGAATGVFFQEPTVAAVEEALLRFERTRFDPEALRRNVQRFHPGRFREGMTEALDELLGRTAEPIISR